MGSGLRLALVKVRVKNMINVRIKVSLSQSIDRYYTVSTQT